MATWKGGDNEEKALKQLLRLRDLNDGALLVVSPSFVEFYSN